jgi:hypothetical protein
MYCLVRDSEVFTFRAELGICEAVWVPPTG